MQSRNFILVWPSIDLVLFKQDIFCGKKKVDKGLYNSHLYTHMQIMLTMLYQFEAKKNTHYALRLC